MRSFIQAILYATRLKLQLQGNLKGNVAPAEWEMVLAQAFLGLLCGLTGGLVFWLVRGDRYVAALLAVVAVVALRYYLFGADEYKCVTEVSDVFCTNVQEKRFSQAIYNLLLLSRPLFIYIILLHGCWIWLPAAAGLAMVFSISPTDKPGWGGKWIAATAVAILSGAFAGKCGRDTSGMFVMSIVAVIVIWLLPLLMQHSKCTFSKNGLLFIGETAALVLGLMGMAL